MSYHPLDRDEKANAPSPEPKEDLDYVSSEDIERILKGWTTPAQIRAKRQWHLNWEAWVAAAPTLPTDRLLYLLRECHKRNDVWVDGVGMVYNVALHNVLKPILDTREHIPNGPQAREIRRQKARRNHGMSKSKNR